MVWKQYFVLQFRMTRRHLKDFGVPVVPVLVLIAIVFIAFSWSLFQKISYAGYVYALLALSFVTKNSEISRNDFLKFVFSARQYLFIRLLENVLTAFAFVIFLCWKQAFLLAGILILLSAALSVVNIRMPGHVTIPTPFYKRPFEFIAGFRKLLLLFIIAFAVSIIAVIYDNINLALFTLAVIFLLCSSFYSDPEDEFYVWVHSLSAAAFLKEKMQTALLYSTLMTLPVAILLVIVFPSFAWMVALLQLLGYGYLITVLLAKYAAYPNRMSLPQSILLAAGIVVPPLILVLIPFFYIQSKKQLNPLLA